MIDPPAFSEAAEDAFSFLPAEYAFAVDRSTPYVVHYTREPLAVGVTYDAHRSGELSFWVTDGRHGEPPLELADALRAGNCGADEIGAVAFMQSSDEHGTKRLLQQAAKVVRRCARAFLAGDEAAFSTAYKLRSQEAVRFTQHLRNSQMIRVADSAWARKDYATVHSLLSPIQESLDPTHARRLRHAANRR